MNRLKRLRRWRRLGAFAIVGGSLFQAATCVTDAATAQQIQQLLEQSIDLAVRQAANILADSIFFALDNLFVRLAA